MGLKSEDQDCQTAEEHLQGQLSKLSLFLF